jgi:hypothetical protein
MPATLDRQGQVVVPGEADGRDDICDAGRLNDEARSAIVGGVLDGTRVIVTLIAEPQ